MKINALTNHIAFGANKMPKSEAAYLNQRLLNADSVDIFCHISSDEDTFNSAKIMHEYLSKNGVKTRIFASNGKRNLDYDEKKYPIVEQDSISSSTEKASLALCLDFSESERLTGKALKYLRSFGKENILCIDHHKATKPITRDFVSINETYEGENSFGEPKNGYSDVTARSTTSVLYRFFESLNIPMSKEQKISAYCGMADDCSKSGLMSIEEGSFVKKKNKFLKDKNAAEVFERLENSIDEKDKIKVLSHIDILSNLSEDEKDFRKKLFSEIKLSDNERYAYAIIEPDNAVWKQLGGDTPATSKILRDFRTRTLAHKKPDEFLSEKETERLKHVKMVSVFYPDYRTGRYKMSSHSKKDFADKILKKVDENYDGDFNAGGHPDRIGGSIMTLEPETCARWVDSFIKSANDIIWSD